MAARIRDVLGIAGWVLVAILFYLGVFQVVDITGWLGTAGLVLVLIAVIAETAAPLDGRS